MVTQTFSDLVEELDCVQRRRELIAELCALNDKQLLDVGLLRGAIPEAAAKILAGQGCPAYH